MLKLTYTETGLHMERVTLDPEVLIAQRAVLAARLGQTLHLEPSQASFLLGANLPQLASLEAVLQTEAQPAIAITPVDEAFVEISLYGHWIADSVEAHEGTFLAAMPAMAERLVHILWQAAQSQIVAWA